MQQPFRKLPMFHQSARLTRFCLLLLMIKKNVIETEKILNFFSAALGILEKIQVEKLRRKRRRPGRSLRKNYNFVYEYLSESF